MSDHLPRGEQRVTSHRPSGLRNEIRLDSTDSEAVHILDSEGFVSETQIPPEGYLPTISHENDKQSDYGGDDGFEDADLIARAVVDKKEILVPASPEWVPLTRDKYQLKYDAPATSSPCFTFGQPGKVVNRSTATDDITRVRPASPSCQKRMADDTTSQSKKEISEVQPEASVSLHNEHNGSKHHTIGIPSSPQQDNVETTDNGRSSEAATRNLQDERHEVQENPHTPSHSAQPPAVLNHVSKKIRSIKKNKKNRKKRKAVLGQQCEEPLSLQGAFGSEASYQAKESYLPMASTSSKEAISNGNQQYPIQGQIVNCTDAPLVIDKIKGDFLVTNAHLHLSNTKTNTQLDQGCPEAILDSDQPQSLKSDHVVVSLAIPVAPQQTPTLENEGKLSPEPRDVIEEILPKNDSESHDHSILQASKPIAGHNSSVSDARSPTNTCPPEMDAQLSMPTCFGKTTANSHRDLPSTEGGQLSKFFPQTEIPFVRKPQKKIRASAVTTQPRPQALNVPSVIEQNFENLRICLLSEQFRREHENKTLEEQHQKLVASLREDIQAKDQVLVEWKGRYEILCQELTNLKTQAYRHRVYAEGLGRDYEKLKKSVVKTMEHNGNIVRDKITEVVKERQDLQGHFEKALGTWSKCQKNMNTTIADLGVQLTASQLARKGHVEILHQQENKLQEERKKRDNLEKALVTTMQAMQHQIGENSTILVSKIENLQSVVKNVATIESRDSHIKECMEGIKKIQRIPFLTVKDIKKAESLLDLVHKRVDEGLESVSMSCNGKDLVMQENHVFLKTQIQNLQAEILKYNEVSADNRRLNEINDAMKIQHELERDNCRHLNEQMRTLQQANKDLQERSIQLECELRDLQTASHEKDLELCVSEKELSCLSQQLKQANDDLITANDMNEQVEKLRKELETTSAQYETRYNSLLEENKAQAQDITEMRENASKEIQVFREKENGYKKEVQNLTHDRNEKEQLLQNLQDELSASKIQLHDLSEEYKAFSMEVDDIRKKNQEDLKLAEERSKDSGLPEDGPSYATITESLQQKTEELESNAKALTLLQQQLSDMRNGRSDLQASYDREVSQHASTVEALRHEYEDRLTHSENCKKNALQILRAEISEIVEEKEDAKANLEKILAELQTSEIRNVELVHERDCLRQSLADNSAANTAKDHEVARLKKNYIEEKDQIVKKHCTEIELLTQRQSQADTALKDAEASLRRQEDEMQAKINYEREKARFELAKVVKEYELLLQSKTKPSGADRPQTRTDMDNSGKELYSSVSLQNFSGRKKVNRLNNSVLNVTDPSTMQQGRGFTFVGADDCGLHRENSNNSDILFEQDTGRGPISNNAGSSQAFSDEEDICDDKITGLAMGINGMDESLNHASRHELEVENISSTSLTRIDSDVLENLERDVTQHCDSGYTMPAGIFSKQPKVVSTQSESISESGSRSSYSCDRPKSQANTASRLVPPTASKQHLVTDNVDVPEEELEARFFESFDASLPEYTTPPALSATIQVQDHRNTLECSPQRDSPDPLQAPDSGLQKKRKGSTGHVISSAKRSRNSSQSQIEEPLPTSKIRSQSSAKRLAGGPPTKEVSQKIAGTSVSSRYMGRNGSSTTATHTPNQDTSSVGASHSRRPNPARFSARVSSSHHSTRSKSRCLNDIYGQRFNQELEP